MDGRPHASRRLSYSSRYAPIRRAWGNRMTDQRTFSWDRRTFIGAGAAATALALGSVPLRILGQDRRLATVGGTAKTRSGSVRGLLKDGVQQFWCVPYGAPTGGANRFMPPQKPAAWSGVKDLFEITFGAPLAPGAEEPSPVVTALNRKGPRKRGLSLRQRIHAGPRQARAARDGLDARRRLHGGLGQLFALRRHEPREEGGRGRRLREPPAQSVRLPASRGLGRREVGRSDECRHPRPRRGARMGARQHRGLRRRPGPCDDLRPVGRRRQNHHRDGDAVREGSVPSRDRAERLRVSRPVARATQPTAPSAISRSWV